MITVKDLRGVNKVEFKDLNTYDTFIWNGGLYMKLGDLYRGTEKAERINALRIDETPTKTCFENGFARVTPVDIEINVL